MTKLTPIYPENFKMDGGACFGVVPKSVWQKTVPCDENNLIELSSRCLLVETNGHLVLIDTGMGNKQSEKYYSFFNRFNIVGLESALMNQGYHPNQITDVIFTHLHADHVGGAVIRNSNGDLTPLFPNATYHCSKAQWEWALDPNPREKASYFPENLLPLQQHAQLNLIEKESSLMPGIEIRFFNGHTRGQIIPIIEYKNRKVVYTADFIPSVMNIPLAYVPSFDIEPLTSMKEKESFLNEALQNNYILFFEHDYYNECCTLTNSEKGIKPDKIFRISDL